MITKRFQLYLLQYFVTASLFLFSSGILSAQQSYSRITGVLIDSSSGKPIEYAPVGLLQIKDSSVVNGTISDDKGVFILEQIKPGLYVLKISFIGYQSFYSDTILVKASLKDINVGNILLLPSIHSMEEVVVTAEKDPFSMSLDKKVFEIDKNPVTAGGSATDVFRQIPAVSVDIDGNISMRGSSNVTVWINGKPSGLTGDSRQAILDQIPASTIERVEIITNPSARYDPDGTSGIINIVLKKNVRFGTNGSITGGFGTRDRWNQSIHKYNDINKYNTSASFNFRNDKWNFSSNYGFRYAQNWQMGNNLRDNFTNGQYANSINQYEQEEKYSASHMLTTNLDYTIDSTHTIGMNAAGGYNYSHEEEILNYNYLDSTRTINKTRNRDIHQHVDAYNIGASVYYRKMYAKPEKELYISGAASYGRNNTINFFNQKDHILANDSFSIASLSHTRPISQNSIYVLQLDYTLPYTSRIKFEAGAKSTLRILNYNLYADSLQYPSSNYVQDNSKTNEFIYNESVNAAYGIMHMNFSHDISGMAGLRVEQTFTDGRLPTLEQNHQRNYTNLFPSAYVAKKFTFDRELRFTYSRRINRPNVKSLNPFPNYSDPLNLSQGNPYLYPEYVHSFDLSFMKTWRAHSISSSLYFREIDGTIQPVTSVNAQDVSVTQFYNLKYAQNFGIEITAKTKLFNRLNLTANINGYRNIIQGSSQSVNISNSNYSYFGKLILSARIWEGMDVQVTGNYMSPVITLQGTTWGNNGIDMGIKKDVLKAKGIVTLNISDVFNTRNNYSTAFGSDFSTHIFRKRETRILTLMFTYKFGRDSTPKTKKTPKINNATFDNGAID